MEPDKNAPGETSPMSGMLSTLLSNPEMLGQLRGILESTAPSGGDRESPAPPPPAQAEPSGTDGLSAVLSNPELMAKLPQMMATLAPAFSSQEHSGGNHPSKNHSPEDCRNDLLLALKPFLSPERRNAVDMILRISRLGTVLRQIK